MEIHFEDRREAGQALGEELCDDYGGRDDVVVLGLARGGLPVAREVARTLEAPLDVVVIRKLGVPRQPELAFGAIAPDGVRVLNNTVVEARGLSKMAMQQVQDKESETLQRRLNSYRGERAPVEMEGKDVIIVDDGLATGASMRAAVEFVRRQSPASVVVAVPTGARESCRQLQEVADEVVCLTTPEMFFGVSQAYRRFEQVDDAQVERILAEFPSEQ